MKLNRKTNDNTALERYYFPERLKKRLSMISNYSVTLVEVPSGFGKTTAVREYLKEHLLEGAYVNWYTCLGETPSKAWEGICRTFNGVNADLAKSMKELYPPTTETLGDIAVLMQGLHCEQETFIVIDNYQLFENDIPRALIDAFSIHESPWLHVIFISQPIQALPSSANNANIHRMSVNDFCFDRESTERYCHLSRIEVGDKEIDEIQKTSEGWISAIQLLADSYKKTRMLPNASGMDALIESAIWNRIPETSRDFFMALALLDAFTLKQAAIISGASSLSKDKSNLLDVGFFISYIADKHVYSIHNIFRSYLLKRFEAQPPEFIKEAKRRAGTACTSIGEYFQAALFFKAVGDYDTILSMPVTSAYMNEQKESNFVDFIEQLAVECSDELLLKYPSVLFKFAFQFLKSGKSDLFSKMLFLMNKFLTTPSGCSQTELAQVKGELATLLSFTAYNDIEKMSAYHKEALECLDEGNGLKHTIVFGMTPWTFGITSVLYMFWSKKGGLEDELSQMDECLPHYMQLAGGHGAGADSVMRAEAALVRGDDLSAETLSHKSLYFARGANEYSICLCAELILGRVVTMRGDDRMLAMIRDNIAKYASESREKVLLRMTELCLAVLDLNLGILERIPDWLRSTETIRKILPVQGHSYGFMLHEKILLLEKRHTELYGLTDPLMGLARGMNYLLPQVSHLICLAVAKRRDDRCSEAAKYLSAALDLALPDKVYLPFAEFADDVLPLLADVKNGNDKKFDALMALCVRNSAGAAKIVKQTVSAQSYLTPREREIALLVQKGLCVRDIAARLFLAESTVKYNLKAVYRKLGVHSKADLMKKFF